MRHTLAALAIASLAACSTTSPDVVQRHETQRLSQVWDATVLSTRPVVVDGTQGGLGGLGGAVVGGVAGSTVGGYRESFIFTVIGAIVGGVVGNAVERGATRENAVEILVQLRSGERRAIVQASGNEVWQVGDPVLLVSSGGRTRVTHAPQIQPERPAAAVPAPVPVYPSSGPVPPRS